MITTVNRMLIPVAEGIDYTDWGHEGTAIKFMDTGFGEVILDAYKLATDEMLEDCGVDMETFILDMFSERNGRAEEEAFIRGDGNGKPLAPIY